MQWKDMETGVVLAPYTSYKIGGPADYFYTARSQAELITSVSFARSNRLPYFLLGTGSNILISDQGFRGLVIHNKADATTVNGNLLTTESGTLISDLIERTVAQGLSGLEHFVGIPSTVGGALWQNVHFLSPDRARTVFIEEILHSAQILDEKGQIRTVEPDFFQFGYDYSILHERDIIALAATFKLHPLPVSLIQERLTANLSWRQLKQPSLQKYPSCGSVFKKIEGVGAGRLIDRAGLKGKRIGDAEVSKKHANFIVNLGQATAADVFSLIQHVQKKVESETGYRLEPEIGFVGDF